MESLVKKRIGLIAVLTSVLFVSFFGILQSCSDEQKELGTDENSSLFSRTGGNYIVGVDKGNGVYEITADKDELLEVFAELALEQGLGEVTYTSLEIKKNIVVGSNPTDYYFGLFASDVDGKYKSAFELNRVGRLFNVNANKGSISCTSTNCGPVDCVPYQQTIAGGNGKVWACTSCTNTCTKSMTVVIKAFEQ
ncbi:MAG TPA: hypothetical protein PLL09_00855 [Flavobacterium sp.]|uniref:hypothetical protein n=1 Tax=unclassified Flavobacterium TaxID=196869 RepID=UPI0025C41E71|nr:MULTISPECIES: hypothetical protein [unclassified Flavobacterium]HRE76350.1 hypothetical protein [Flavobacterium sp.]